MKRFNELTDAEVLALDNETLNTSIRLEAIHRGIEPPITLSEALRRSEWLGYEEPGESIKVYRIRQCYQASDFGWLDEGKARAAMTGMVKLQSRNYNDRDLKIVEPDFGLETVWVGVSKSSRKAVKFEEFFQDNTAFDKLTEECLERASSVRQADYNRKVNEETKAEYLRLAGGNEEIARGFWAKLKTTPWPE